MSYQQNPIVKLKEKSSAKKVAVLVADGFDEWDFTITGESLRAAGCAVSIVRPGIRDVVRSWDSVEDEWGQIYAVDEHLSWSTHEAFDALVIPGGLMSVDALRLDDETRVFIGEFIRSDRPVAAICHAPQLLIDATDIRGREVASCRSIRSDLQNAGARWVDEAVVEDGNLYTCPDTDAVPVFSEVFQESVTVQPEVPAIAM